MDIAVADLKRAGGTDDEVAALKGDRSPLPVEWRRVLDVARELTRAAYKVTDDQMATRAKGPWRPEARRAGPACRVRELPGSSAAVAGRAAGSRADRCRRPESASSGPGWAARHGRDRQPKASTDGPPETVTDPDWRSTDFKALQQFMEAQRGREPRVSVPKFEDVKKHLPEGAKPVRIKWSLVCLGHSADLAAPWTLGLRTFAEESKQDRVFEESLFWVVTRELQCFY